MEANQSLLDIFGYTRDELNSFNVLDSYADPDARKEVSGTHNNAKDR